MTPTYHRAALNETLLERRRFQARFLVFQAKTRGRRESQGVVDTTTVHRLSSSNLSRCRLPVLKLYKKNFFQSHAYVISFIIAVCCCLSFLPHVSDDSSARISETCLILCLAPAAALAKCRVVEWSTQHLGTYKNKRRLMSVDFEWHFCPTQSPSEPACSPHRSCPLWPAVFVPSTATEAPATVANIAYPTRAIDRSKLEVETANLGFSVSASM